MRFLVAVIALLVVAGCGAPEEVAPTVASPPDTPTQPTDSTPVPSTTLLPSATATTPIESAALFLAIVEEGVADTDLAGFAGEDPEAVLAIGQLFCELRDGGLSDRDILTAHLERVASQRALTEADALFAGIVFGAAEIMLCPVTG